MVFSFTKPRGRLLLALALAAPGFALAQSGAPSAQALAYFTAQSERQGLHGGDAASPSVTSSYFDQSSGLTHTFLRQRVNGLDVFGAVGDVHTDRTGKPVLMHQSFVADAAQLAPSAVPTLTAQQAVSAAAKGLGLPRPTGLTLVREARPGDGLLFNNGGISENDIPVRLMYLPAQGQLKLVWNVSLAELAQPHSWVAQVDAHTGQLIDKLDVVISEEISFQQLTNRALGKNRPSAATPTPRPAQRGGLGAANSMTVWPVPVEAPNAGSRVSVPFSSANPLYSPYGWHVSDPRATVNGTSIYPNAYSRLGAGVFLTRGNNVAAYDDAANTSQLLSNTNSPDGGATLDFDFPFNQPAGAKYSEPAAITNLFYWNNMIHDVMMSKGFDEAAANFQYKNRTGLGLGGDFVRAEAQDGSGRNNANFTPSPEGQPGKMQMYLFDGAGVPTFSVLSPAGLGTLTVGTASFGRPLKSYPTGLCGNVVLVNDGVSADGGLHGCASPYANARAVNGNIALIMRGGCAQLTGTGHNTSSFAGKVLRAQQNGAIMAIIIDSVATNTTLSGMTGGADTVGIRIPSIFLRGTDGDRIRQALLAGTPVSGCATEPQDFDGAVDNLVVTHEYGHGIANRLTGGGATNTCMVQATTTATYQSMGEGLSDFFGLWMTTRTGDVGRTPRGTGSYLYGLPASTFNPAFRYNANSDNMAVNGLTYAVVGTGNYRETHAIGEVWAAVLWDLNWQFIYRYGYNPDFFAQNGGNNKFLKLVLQGNKLQICNPGFLDARDAILRADTLLNGATNSGLLWTMFARRGMGYSAQQGPRVMASGLSLPGLTGIVAAFDIPPRAGRPVAILNPATTPLGTQSASAGNGSLVSAYPNPAQHVLTVQAQLASKSAVQVSLVNLVGQVVSTVSTTAADVQRGLEVNTSTLASGLYVVRVNTSEGVFTTKVQVQH